MTKNSSALTVSPKKQAVLFGASQLGQYAASVLGRDYDVLAFLDNDRAKWGGLWADRPVYGPEYLQTLKSGSVEIIITSVYHREISRQLASMGADDHLIFDAPYRLLGSQSRVKPDFVAHISKVRTNFGETLANIHALGYRPGTLIDVGVAFGTPELYQGFPDSDLIMIEPLDEFRLHMESIAAKRCGARFLVAAAGSKVGSLEISVTPDKSTSSLRAIVGAERRSVPVVRVDDLCRDWEAKSPYVLKVDVQGAELGVLEGCTGILPETIAVILEVSMWGNDADVPDLAGMLNYMKQRGFAAYDVVGGHNRPLDGARWQVDVVFTQRDGPLYADRRWSTPEQRQEFLDAKRTRSAFRKIMGAR